MNISTIELLHMALIKVGTMRMWYEDRIDIGYPYYVELAQMRIFHRYLRVMIYLERRSLRAVRV